ncbi:hypothetical protein ACFC6U_27910 [Kitasatospora purpeofusca]|uniref:hypothetical protein n=1 Tax=Kitasatospora purpeofusca TaxID=67352 RepID=UPI0035D7EC67
MSKHFANVEVFVSNLESANEADDVVALVEAALNGRGYQASVSATAHAYPAKEDER